MPGLSTHYLFGIKALKNIKGSKLHALIKEYPCVYALGQQGPDLLFYYPSYIKNGNIGVRMHEERTADFFHSMLKYIDKYSENERERNVLIVYFAGFLGHYVLDRTFHPYVYAFSTEGCTLKQHGRHFKIEADIDAYFLKNIKKTHPGFFKGGKTLALSPWEENAIIHMLRNVIFYTYGEKLGRRRLKITLCIMRMVHALLRDKRGIKKRLITSVEAKMLGFQLLGGLVPEYRENKKSKATLNISRDNWKSPWEDEERNKSVPDMLRAAKEEYTGILMELDSLLAGLGKDKKKFIDFIGCYSYKTGRLVL
ncbi:MAG: zinc dependent phospholipase C family protein [Lachnospiraceae bacterium]|nr:zinc dependent phospholipase C family protein [Lachnospiraceae bacterium]